MAFRQGMGLALEALTSPQPPSPSPLAPFLSRAAGEEGGDYAPHLPPAPFRSHAVGEEGG